MVEGRSASAGSTLRCWPRSSVRPGRVVSVDIDSEVVEKTHSLLDAVGYPAGSVVRADAEHPVPVHVRMDREVNIS